jgi:hypothetical protein
VVDYLEILLESMVGEYSAALVQGQEIAAIAAWGELNTGLLAVQLQHFVLEDCSALPSRQYRLPHIELQFHHQHYQEDPQVFPVAGENLL